MHYTNKNHNFQPSIYAANSAGQKVQTIPRRCHHVLPPPKGFKLQLLNQCLESDKKDTSKTTI